MLTGGRWPIIEPNNDLRQWRLGEVMPEENKQQSFLSDEPYEVMDEGFGAIAIPFVIAALLTAGAVIWSFV